MKGNRKHDRRTLSLVLARSNRKANYLLGSGKACGGQHICIKNTSVPAQCYEAQT